MALFFSGKARYFRRYFNDMGQKALDGEAFAQVGLSGKTPLAFFKVGEPNLR